MANVTINQLPVASTIDAVQDLLPIFTNTSTSTQAISRNTLLGLTSAPVGLTDSQTLTNKILTSPTLNTPTISSPTLSGTIAGTYTIGGTPTFPASVVTLTGSQTLTNKVLTAPTITNATISADTLTGFTVSNNGTVYGISVTAGQITSAAIANGTLTSTQIATNGISAANLATNAIKLGYAGITSAFTGTATSFTLITGLSVAVTVPSGGRDLKITFVGSCNASAGAGNNFTLDIFDATTSTEVGATGIISIPTASFSCNASFVARVAAPSAGAHTYQVRYTHSSAGTFTCNASATGPAFILVEAI